MQLQDTMYQQPDLRSKIGSPLKLKCWGIQPWGLWFESWSLKVFFQFDFSSQICLESRFGDFWFDVCWTKLLARLFWSAERWLTHMVWVSSFVNQAAAIAFVGSTNCYVCVWECLNGHVLKAVDRRKQRAYQCPSPSYNHERWGIFCEDWSCLTIS